ncbi:MAG: hypothetical protein U0694_21620, partial [Anaerolineae bacterium]
MTITYTTAVDLNDDGDYVDASEALSTDVVMLHWRLGMAAPYDSLGAPSQAQITLRNTTQKYSPETVAALALLPGKRLRITSFDGTITRTHFTGIIERVEPLAGTLGKRSAVIHAVGPEKQLTSAEVRLAPQLNVRSDVAVNAVLAAVPLRRAILKGCAVLDVVGYAELGTNTTLADAYPNTLDVGKSTFTYVGDTWAGGIAADDALRQLVESERGRFFFNRQGDAVFINRHYTLLATTSSATFDDSADELEYAYGGDLANRVTVSITPRSIGAAATTLWRVDSAQRVNALSRREIIARYRDADKRSVGALAVIAPLPGVDFVANTAADGTGTDVTAYIEVVLLRADFSAATLEVRNSLSAVIYLLPGTQLRGTPLVRDDPLLLQQTDWTSVTFHGLRALRFDLPALSSADEAEQVVNFELARRTSPRGTLRRIHLSTIKHAAAILARTLFDRITVSDTQTGHSADYFIIAEEHTVDLGGTRHRTTW